jgi:hypothetical protein
MGGSRVTARRSRTFGMSRPHPDCEPQHHCRGCGKPVLCGEDIVVPWRSGRRYVVRHADCDGPTGWRRVYHCSTACYWRQLRARRREERSRSVICESCGGTFQAPRRGARYCSGSCRQDAYRRRREAA